MPEKAKPIVIDCSKLTIKGRPERKIKLETLTQPQLNVFFRNKAKGCKGARNSRTPWGEKAIDALIAEAKEWNVNLTNLKPKKKGTKKTPA